MHDFFSPQPIKYASLFLVRAVMHDWSDKYAVQILRHLREAAAPDTRLMIADSLMAYACVNKELEDIPGATVLLPPAPLLPNGGHASVMRSLLDVHVRRFCFPQARHGVAHGHRDVLDDGVVERQGAYYYRVSRDHAASRVEACPSASKFC